MQTAQTSAPGLKPARAGSGGGRRPSTTYAELGDIGIKLFVERGYDKTSIDEIAAAAGIARRTFFGYFPAKADLVWGDFDAELGRMRAFLGAVPDDLPMMEALRLAVIDFNAVPPEAQAPHRQRMTLILTVPSLIAHSTLRYAQWRAVVAEFAARRMDLAPDDLEPNAIGYCALGASIAAYHRWLAEEGADLTALLDRAFAGLARGFDSART